MVTWRAFLTDMQVNVTGPSKNKGYGCLGSSLDLQSWSNDGLRVKGSRQRAQNR